MRLERGYVTLFIIPLGYSWECLVRVCRLVLQILTLFQTKKCHFQPVFSPWPLRNDVVITYINKSSNIIKDFLKSISSSRISLSFLLLLINTFVHSRSFLENHIQFQTKMGQVYTHFQTKTAQKPYPLGRHIPI